MGHGEGKDPVDQTKRVGKALCPLGLHLGYCLSPLFRHQIFSELDDTPNRNEDHDLTNSDTDDVRSELCTLASGIEE